MTNSKVIEGLKPARFWFHLARIAEIPRESGNETAVREYVIENAKRCGLLYKTDKRGNAVVRHPATDGLADLPSVALQGHLDMVCEKNADVKHDFLRDPIRFVRKGNIMKADGTSAGFDNGVGAATMCMLMEDTEAHGSREYLFTVEEETGLFGANALLKDFIASKIFINLDTEEEGKLYVGCAGGKQTSGTLSVKTEKIPEEHQKCTLSITGLRGGHSGVDIHEARGNAIKILAEVLLRIHEETDARISHLEGGSKHNAIPREALAHFHIPKNQMAQVERLVKDSAIAVKNTHQEKETELSVEFFVSEDDETTHAFSLEFQTMLLKTLLALPHGVHKMSEQVPGLTETSSNLAVLKHEKGEIHILTSHRSLVDSELKKTCEKIEDIFERNGFFITKAEGYPSWTPDLDSALLQKAITVYEKLFGIAPEIKAIHAGLECGIIGEKFPGTDMLSIGPTIRNPHSPDEFLEIDTVPKFLKFLTALIGEIK